MTTRPLPPDFEATLIRQVQEARRPAPQQPLVIHVGEGATMNLVLGGTATVLQLKV